MIELADIVLQKVGAELLWKPALHFVSSGSVGLLVYWWTSTTLLRGCSGITGFPRFVGDDSGIHRFSFLLALLFAVWFHILQDYTLNWF